MVEGPYNAFLTRNNLEPLEFDRKFAEVITRALGPSKFVYSKNPAIPNKVHIYFPHLLVKTSEMGLEWLAVVRQEFEQSFASDGEDWDKVFDRGVLKNGSASLRMLGSHSDKRNGAYKILDLISGELEDITTTHLSETTLRTEIHMDDSPFKEGGDPEYSVAPITSIHEESLKKYAETLKNISSTQPLKFKGVKPGFFANSFVVDLEDRFCSLVNRPHNRKSTYICVFTRHSTRDVA